MARLESSFVETTRLVQPGDTNSMDVAHGGDVVKWMDDSATLSAMRFSKKVCVTSSILRVDFHYPIEVGYALILESYVYRGGNTSLGVHVRVLHEDIKRSEKTVTTESLFTFVAIDSEGEPTEVPELEIETDRERKLHERAERHLDQFSN